MAAVNSTMQALGTGAPDFCLPDVRADNLERALTDYQAKPLFVMFICNHCPYVVHILPELIELSNKAQRDGFAVLAISANDVQNYPQDGPEKMAELATQYGFEFPYCYDETQEAAKRYGAACTPDFFVYDAAHRLVYRGQMDDSRPGNGKPVTGNELSAALTAVLAGELVSEQQTPSVGCNIKWRADNAPDYF